jgi:hypothetical protein
MDNMELWGGEMMVSRKLGNNQDFIMGVLRSQVAELDRLLTAMEDTSALEEYVPDRLKRVEINIRGLRKLCMDN